MARPSKTSPTRKTMAIVGDGETEFFYFQDFKSVEKLSVTLKPDLPTKSGWAGVMLKAENLIKKGGYDKIFCIIDYDVVIADNAVQNYKSVKQKCLNIAKKSGSEIVFIEIMPCIELWFYLHFNYTTKSLRNCNSIHTDLKEQYIPDYNKTQPYHQNKRMYSFLIDKLPIAIANAQRLGNEKSKTEHAANPHFPFSELYIVFHELLSEERKRELKF